MGMRITSDATSTKTIIRPARRKLKELFAPYFFLRFPVFLRAEEELPVFAEDVLFADEELLEADEAYEDEEGREDKAGRTTSGVIATLLPADSPSLIWTGLSDFLR